MTRPIAHAGAPNLDKALTQLAAPPLHTPNQQSMTGSIDSLLTPFLECTAIIITYRITFLSSSYWRTAILDWHRFSE